MCNFSTKHLISQNTENTSVTHISLQQTV